MEENEKTEFSNKDKLLEISQLCRKFAYWIDSDTKLPDSYNRIIDLMLNQVRQMNKFVMDQMVDVSDNLNEEVKSVPTDPNIWSTIKKHTLEKSGKKELGKIDMWHANREYKNKGGKWRKRKRKKDNENYD
jgi:hypothetical protein